MILMHLLTYFDLNRKFVTKPTGSSTIKLAEEMNDLINFNKNKITVNKEATNETEILLNKAINIYIYTKNQL